MSIKLNGVMETLLITLSIRAKDAMSSTPVINDKKAAEMIKKIDYNFEKFDNCVMSYYGVLARAKIMDEQARKFIRKNPNCIIVSVGCGLDTRFSRVDNGKIQWYNLDFPEVIAQRDLFFESHDRVKNIAKSALDPTWPQDIEINGTLKKTNAQFNWGVKDGSEVVNLCPVMQQKGLINFTDALKHLLPGAKKLLTPLMYITNNRLGIYTYKKAHNN